MKFNALKLLKIACILPIVAYGQTGKPSLEPDKALSADPVSVSRFRQHGHSARTFNQIFFVNAVTKDQLEDDRTFNELEGKTVTTNKWQVVVGLHPGLTTNAIQNATLGGEVGLLSVLAKNLQATLSLGFTRFFTNKKADYISYPEDPMYYNIGPVNSNAVAPVKAGLRLFLTDQFFIAGDAGAGFTDHGNTSFVYAPAIGFAKLSGVDIGLKYESFTSDYVPDQIAFKIGYRFKL